MVKYDALTLFTLMLNFTNIRQLTIEKSYN